MGKVEFVRSFRVNTFIVLSYKKRICKIAHSFWYDVLWLSFLNTHKSKVTQKENVHFSGGSREGPGGPTLFLDQTEARRAEKSVFGDRVPPFLRI